MGTTVVIGAGVIGLACAYELQKRGREVLVLDRGEPGRGCSAGNAGWVVPALSDPIPAPGLVTTSLRWMLKSDSPLYIRPRVDLAFASWLWRFWRNCREEPHRAGLAAVMSLNRETFQLFDEWRNEGLEFEMKQNGLLFAGLSDETVTRAAAGIERLTEHGYQPVEKLDGSSVRDLEPGISERVAGGFLLPDERTVRPEQLTASLAEAIVQRGGEIRANVDVIGARTTGDEVRELDTTAGTIACDATLIAAGAWSGVVSSFLGVPLPIEAGKGYSITVASPAPLITRPVELIEARAVATPFDGALRLAGTMELSGRNLRLAPSRVAAIRRAGDTYLPGWRGGGDEDVWVGMRPLTPDGLPLLGALPGFANAFVATGHAMLGVTLAPATAKAVAAIMTSDERSDTSTPFDPARYLPRKRRESRPVSSS